MARIGDLVGKRLARKAAERAEAERRPTTAFVLSGGGVLGAVQVGQITALIESGIVPDMIVASSVGSLNAAMLAADPTIATAHTMAEIWGALRTEDVFPGSRVKRAWHIVARGDHLYPNDGIRRLVAKLPITEFEQTKIPLHVCTTNLSTGEEHWISSGPLLPAILASTALPGVFPPVTLDGTRYVDGGVVNNVPISRAVELGADRIYVLECGTAAAHNQARIIRRPLDVLVAAFAHARAARTALDYQRCGQLAEIVRVATVDAGPVRFDDLSNSRRLMAKALEAARAQLLGVAAVEA